MTKKCCCCLSLYAGTSVALAFAAVEAVIGIVVNVELLLLATENEVFNPARLVINIATIEDFDVFHGIVLAGLGLNAFWFAFGIFAAKGNISQSHGQLNPWVYMTYLITVFKFGVSIYFAVKFQSSLSETMELYRGSVPTNTLAYLTLVCIYSGGGIFILLNIYLAHIVESRGKEIDHNFSALALYILSHMGRCSHINEEIQENLLPEAPPSYDSSCPPYLSPEIFQRTNSGNGSSWSLSCETLKGTSTGPVTTCDINSIRRNVLTAEHLATLMNRNAASGYQPLNVDTNDSSALPY